MVEGVRPAGSLPISRIRVEGSQLCCDEQLVFCQRRSGMVSVGQCRECRHFRALRPARRDALAGVVCDDAPPQSDGRSRLSLPRLSVGDLMSRDIVCVRPDLSLDAAALLMLEQPGQTLPVVDADGHVVGSLRDADLQLEIQANRTEAATVETAMTPCAVTVPEATPVTRAAAIMAFEGVACLIVVCPAGTVSGVLTTADLLSWLAHADGYMARSLSSAPPSR